MTATAANVESVYNATKQCKTLEEIAKYTSLPNDVIEECISTLKEIGVLASDDVGRYCNVDAVKSLKDKFDKICVLCKG
ncbi:MAG: hypothetical protein WC565_03200 [Parcubacteria group bacterium]|jgi:predicted transcriptional regulator